MNIYKRGLKTDFTRYSGYTNLSTAVASLSIVNVILPTMDVLLTTVGKMLRNIMFINV